MISFRFHLVSIVAVFLALAIGIIVGSTVIDRAIVEGLRNRVDEVSANLDERQAANDELSGEVDQLQTWVTDAGPFAVDGRLQGAFTVLITDGGVDGGPVDRTLELLDQAGARVRGVLTIDGSWTLEDDETRAALAEVVGAEADEPVEDLQQRAADLLVSDLSSSVTVIDDEVGATDAIAELGLVDYEVLDDTVAPRPRRVLFTIVTGPESDLGSSAHVEHFAVAATEEAGGAVVAEVWVESEDGPDRADSLAPILGSPTLLADVATVDDLDLVQGPATAVLTLAAVRAGEIGHYGVGDGAEAAAPPPPEGR